MRLIDADNLLEKMRKTSRYFEVKFDIEEQQTIDLETLPIVQELRKKVKELGEKNKVIHAHWIFTRDYITTAEDEMHFYECSICGEYSLEEGNYCPHCGAKMEE